MEIFNSFVSLIPAGVIVALVAVVLMTEATKTAIALLEVWLEEKKGRQIRLFDHTKIILTILWSVIMTVVIVYAEVIPLKAAGLYLFVIIGAACVLYELIIKKIKKLVGGDV